MKIGFVTIMVKWWILLACVASIVATFFWPPAILVLVAYIALLAHELAHAFMGRKVAVGQTVISLHGVMKGHAQAAAKRRLDPEELVAYLLVGPWTGMTVGLVAVVVTAALGGGWVAKIGAAAIILLHASNLLPWKKGSDGYKIREALRLRL